jgi:hypothetical protein
MLPQPFVSAEREPDQDQTAERCAKDMSIVNNIDHFNFVRGSEREDGVRYE